MTAKIDLNADLGEGSSQDESLMSVITSCNIACGGHAGNETSMRAALSLAKKYSVSIGVHPSFPDRENFGRKPSSLAGAELEAELSGQVLTLKRLAHELDVEISHLKPHGALYNMAASDRKLSQSIVAILRRHLPHAKLFGLPKSELEAVAQSNEVDFVAEGFADRAYEANGHLRNRSLDGAMITEHERQADQAVQMVFKQSVKSLCGSDVAMPVRTICVHGDTAGAFAAAKLIRKALTDRGVELCPPP
ncbi:MAG: 5-oxoprolinase subunit PxpA [Pseudomonadota bacterium]